jgi:hypothetical protein
VTQRFLQCSAPLVVNRRSKLASRSSQKTPEIQGKHVINYIICRSEKQPSISYQRRRRNVKSRYMPRVLHRLLQVCNCHAWTGCETVTCTGHLKACPHPPSLTDPLLRCLCFDLGNHTSAPSRENLGLKGCGAMERQNKREISKKKMTEKRGLAGKESAEDGINGKKEKMKK